MFCTLIKCENSKQMRWGRQDKIEEKQVKGMKRKRAEYHGRE